jgi:hypothetical protein
MDKRYSLAAFAGPVKPLAQNIGTRSVSDAAVAAHEDNGLSRPELVVPLSHCRPGILDPVRGFHFVVWVWDNSCLTVRLGKPHYKSIVFSTSTTPRTNWVGHHDQYSTPSETRLRHLHCETTPLHFPIDDSKAHGNGSGPR